MNQNSIIVIVEDPENNMEKIKEKIDGIENIKFNKDIDSKTKEYEIFVKKESDIRKDLFKELPKENITLLELKSSEVKLEEVFMNLIDEKEEK